jgi:RecJ-like exonuclease
MKELKKIECDFCDGTGTYEGGQFIETTCQKCGGKGYTEISAETEASINKMVDNIFEQERKDKEYLESLQKELAELRAERDKWKGLVKGHNKEAYDELMSLAAKLEVENEQLKEDLKRLKTPDILPPFENKH